MSLVPFAVTISPSADYRTICAGTISGPIPLLKEREKMVVHLPGGMVGRKAISSEFSMAVVRLPFRRQN